MSPSPARLTNRSIFAFALLLIVTAFPAMAAPTIADVVYYNGLIYTLTEDYTRPAALDPSRARTVEAVAVKDGKISFTGTIEQAKLAGYLDPARVGCLADLKGETMLPGFVDSHGNFPPPGKGGRVTPALALADARHIAAGVTTADMGGAILTQLPANVAPALLPKSESGERTGVGLFDFQQATLDHDLHIRLIIHPLAEGVAGAINRAFLGWDSSGPAKGLPDSIGKADVKTAAARTVGHDLTNYRRSEDLSPVPPHRLFLGAWKLVLDGPLEDRAAWLKSPGYRDGAPGPDPLENGRVYDTIKNMEFYHLNGEPFEVHATGDMAVEAVVSELEDLASQSPVTDMRHAIVHAELAERQHIDRLTGRYADLTDALRHSDPSQLGGVATDPALRSPTLAEAMQGQHFVNDYAINGVSRRQELGLDAALPPERLANLCPTGWSVACNQPFALHDDTPDIPVAPLRSVQAAVTRGQVPDSQPADKSKNSGEFSQRINILQALHAVTTVPAYRNHMERYVGSIEPGKLADFVLMDWNPVEIAGTAPEKLADIPILATIVGGKVVYGKLPAPCANAEPARKPDGDNSMVGGIRSR